jgi:hypothetical protein
MHTGRWVAPGAARVSAALGDMDMVDLRPREPAKKLKEVLAISDP